MPVPRVLTELTGEGEWVIKFRPVKKLDGKFHYSELRGFVEKRDVRVIKDHLLTLLEWEKSND